MTDRLGQGFALVGAAKKQAELARKAYEQSLHSQSVSDDLKISIKNLFENLRSVLDYIAHEIRGRLTTPVTSSTKPSFPIRTTDSDFDAVMRGDFPNITTELPDVEKLLRAVQPYQKGHEWLGRFNQVNNENKHSALVEQKRTESVRITARSAGGGAVSWDPNAVRFGAGVLINGVPVNPATQLPIPHPSQTVEKTTWVDFRFEGVDCSALQLMDESCKGVEAILEDMKRVLP